MGVNCDNAQEDSRVPETLPVLTVVSFVACWFYRRDTQGRPLESGSDIIWEL